MPSKISITIDTWTSRNQISFLDITAHWISITWNQQETLLDFCQLKGPHSGENLSEELFKVLKEFDILNKVSIIY